MGTSIHSQVIVERANGINNWEFLLSIGDNAIVVLAVGGGVVRKAEANKKADRWISRRTETWR